ncbi:MAG: ABC transporter permease [Thaumarchaeota archaeon]|nr:ABC transporter permease [Nitrososphaerota archaeon]
MAGFVTFLIRRSVNALITILLMIFMIFVLIHVVAPTPIAQARLVTPNPRASKAVLEVIARNHGFYDPIYVQFWHYVTQIFSGNLGTDLIYGVPVIDQIRIFLPVSYEMVLAGAILAVIIGLYTGAVSAANRGAATDMGVKGLYLATWSAPTFLMAVLVQLVFAYWLHLLPSNGIANPLLAAPKAITGFPFVDGLLAGNWAYAWSVIQHMILPSLSLGLLSFGVVTRLTRASMVDALDKDYVRLAYMKGLSKRNVVYGTAFRNAMIPIITLIALIFGTSVAGAVIIEDLFNYRGIGYFAVSAVYNLDYVAILAITIIVGISVIAANFIADVLYGVIDPRVRLS